MEPFVNLSAELQKIAATYAVVVSLAPLESQASLTAGSSVTRRKVNRSSAEDCKAVFLSESWSSRRMPGVLALSTQILMKMKECTRKFNVKNLDTPHFAKHTLRDITSHHTSSSRCVSLEDCPETKAHEWSPAASKGCKQSGSEWNHCCPNMPRKFLNGPGSWTTWLCNRFVSMVSAWLGICKVSCYTYMNVSNNCHSAKTTCQLPVTNGFTMIADDGMTLSSRL